MIRTLDVILSAAGLILLSPLLALLFLIGLGDTGSPLFRQTRMGRNRHPFTLVKFRTMCPGTASTATHLADPASITPTGRFLRATKLDELPQLWNVLKGDMSLVGPRPCLPTQVELIEARLGHGVFDVAPGITGLAQIRGIDMSTARLLAETDAEMVRSLAVATYFRYLLLTALGRGAGDRVKARSADRA
jgi:O-antigen biosynthesis protein WbqP